MAVQQSTDIVAWQCLCKPDQADRTVCTTVYVYDNAALCTHCMCRDDSLRWLPLCRPPILKCFDRALDNNKIATLDASLFSGLSSLQQLFVWPRCHMHDTHAMCMSIVYVQTHATSSRMCVTIVACCTGGMRWCTYAGACTVRRKQLFGFRTLYRIAEYLDQALGQAQCDALVCRPTVRILVVYVYGCVPIDSQVIVPGC